MVFSFLRCGVVVSRMRSGGSLVPKSSKIRLFLAAILTIAVFGLGTTPADAQSYDPEQDVPQPTKLEKRINKLGRGLSNIIFGWTEIPITFDQRLKAGKPLTYLLTTAPVLGATRAVMRTGVGIYEVFTFPASGGEVNYEAILEPDYLF